MKLQARSNARALLRLSVLSVEPYGMKQMAQLIEAAPMFAFSALGRAVWDETAVWRWRFGLSRAFSALGRAVWDETPAAFVPPAHTSPFQCSRSSRMG